jgi:hypothetical protein
LLGQRLDPSVGLQRRGRAAEHGAMPEEEHRVESAAPPQAARVLAFVAILVAGVCGGVIGLAVVDLQCTGECTTNKGLGAAVGAVLAAVGVAVVSVLVLRAMGEWRTISHRNDT